MPQGLSVSRLIALSLSLTPTGAQFANFNSLLVLGQSNVIDVGTRIASFNSIEDVAAAFGTTDPEYLAAVEFFEQSPQPTQLYIGRWAQTATQGLLFGAALSPTQQALANFTAITTGGFKITINGGPQVNVSGINLSSATNLNGVATLINTALTGATVAASVVWNGTQFVFSTNTTGASAAIVPLVAPTSGTDISGLLGCNAGASPRAVNGIAAETALQAVTILDGLSTQWFALSDEAATSVVDADREAIAAYIEAAAHPHLYGFTTAAAGALVSATTTDIGSVLQAGGYKKTFVFWSQMTPYAACGAFGGLLTTNFQGSDTTITLAYKQIVGMTPDVLTDAQAAVLDSKGYNYYAGYNNGVAIITNAWCVCSSPEANQVFIDEIYGAMALANFVQTNVFDLLVSTGKVPQTDAGNHLVANAMESALKTFVDNGYLAPGTWNSGGFGQLAQGQFLPKGYYIYQPPIANQLQASRAARQSVAFQIAAKTAGALQGADIALTVNP